MDLEKDDNANIKHVIKLELERCVYTVALEGCPQGGVVSLSKWDATMY